MTTYSKLIRVMHKMPPPKKKDN